jgi:hypothetical protein
VSSICCVIITRAIDLVARQQRDAPESKTALYVERRRILEKAKQNTLQLDRPGRTSTYIYSRPTDLSTLSIGLICCILPKDLDAALIKVRLAPDQVRRRKKKGFADRAIFFALPVLCRFNTTIHRWLRCPKRLPQSRLMFNFGDYQRDRYIPPGLLRVQRLSSISVPRALLLFRIFNPTLSKAALQEMFGKGEERLMKFGARTGFSAFHAGPSYDPFLSG